MGRRRLQTRSTLAGTNYRGSGSNAQDIARRPATHPESSRISIQNSAIQECASLRRCACPAPALARINDPGRSQTLTGATYGVSPRRAISFKSLVSTIVSTISSLGSSETRLAGKEVVHQVIYGLTTSHKKNK